MKKITLLLFVAVIVVVGLLYQRDNFGKRAVEEDFERSSEETSDVHPLSIESLRAMSTPGSEMIIEENLSSGSNYKRYVAYYVSEGNKIYGLLTIPNGNSPDGGWPVILFNHGYIPPNQYRTTERYVSYVDAFARNGYVVFKSDYRGHGDSEGQASGGYGSNGYTIDVLNALSSIKKYPGVNPEKIGMWGHSMGGYITLRAMVTRSDIKVGVIWAGVVGSYEDLLNNWRRRNSPSPSVTPMQQSRRWRQELVDRYGTPESNPDFWNSISANSYLSDISGPVQLHHGTADTSVPVSFSENLASQLKDEGRDVELYTYNGDDHNISKSFSTAMNRTVAFFDKNLK